LTSGTTNDARGRALRGILALDYDAKPYPVKSENFANIQFRNKKAKKAKQKSCEVCFGLFEKLPAYAAAAVRELKGIEYHTFVVGTILSRPLATVEEEVWEEIGTEFCEPLKAEVNRELGKLISNRTGKDADEQIPDVTVTLNLAKRQFDVKIASLYVYGEYQKLVRGIPQTKWDKYRVTVEDIIAKPFMCVTKGTGHSLHALGREDIDARCLGKRPFVLEIKNPKKRTLNLTTLRAAVNQSKKVQIFNLRWSDVKEVVALKESRAEKSYRVLVRFKKPVTEKDLKMLKKLVGSIRQHTPTRVLHRRANKLRRRRLCSMMWKRKGKDVEFTIRGEAGLYVKELITGDNGRTQPSAAGLLKNPAVVKALDVIAIHRN